MKPIGPISSTDAERLGAEPSLAEVDPGALRTLLAGAEVWQTEAGERVAEAGEPQAALFLLLEGLLTPGPSGAPLSPGALLGAASLMEGLRWPATLIADAAVRLVRLDWDAVRQACCDLGERLEPFAALRPILLQQRYLSRALRESAVFGDLEPELLRTLETSMALRVVAGGAYLLREGEPSDSLLIVVSGRLRASRRRPDGRQERLNEIGPGDSVGEIGLVLRQPRAADVIAVRDSTVALLYRDRFETLLTRHPIALNRAVTRIVVEYAKDARLRSARHTAQTFAVVPLHDGAATAELARRLRAELASAGEVHHLTPHEGAALDHGDEASAEAIGRLSELEHRFDFLIYETDATPAPWTGRAVRQADQVLLVADASYNASLHAVERFLAELPSFALMRKSLVLLHPADAAQPRPLSAWRIGRELERIYPLRTGDREGVARLARFLTGRAVGLVLGGGGARGFASVGVLRALAEAEVPIDLIGGNSMGALIAAQFAAGRSLDEIIEQTRRFVYSVATPVLPLVSLFSGKPLIRDLKRMFGDTLIEELWHPFYAVSCNLSRARMELHDEGPLWRAVLASNSAAGLLPPTLEKGDLLVDGAVMDNVPVEPMRGKIGFGTVIAVDVELREELSVDPAIARLSTWQALKQRIHGSDERRLPGIVDIIARAGIVGGLAQQKRGMQVADRYLQPPVAQFSKLGYLRAREIAEAGYRYAVEQIATWDPKPGR